MAPMKSCLPGYQFLLLFVLVGLLSGCGATGTERTRAATPTGAKTPDDTTYLVDGEIVSLHHGRAIIEVAPGAASKTVIEVFGNPVPGDLDDDGTPDAAALLVKTTGGSGTFYYVAAAFNRGGKFFGTAAVLLGDRIAPRQLTIRHGMVIVAYADRRPGEAMATNPTVELSKYLVVNDIGLEEVPLAGGEVIMAGDVVIGHEVRSFTACDDHQTAWLLGDSPALAEVRNAYLRAMRDASPYAPLFMVLAGQPFDRPTEGFGANYPAGFRVTHVIRSLPGGACSSQ